jgi:Mn2+/Fe2+ NRAMP family transporter
MFASQVVNAVLLPLHAIALQMLIRDPKIMGDLRPGRLSLGLGWMGVIVIVACISALAVSWITSNSDVPVERDVPAASSR